MSTTTPFVITTAGLAAASVATPTGPWVDIVAFKLGNAYGYTPVAGDTDLHGTLQHEGVPYSYRMVDSDTLDIVLSVDSSTGPFYYGEVGLYLPGDVLFALASWSDIQFKTASSGVTVGNRLRIHSLIRLDQGAAVMNITTTNTNQLMEVPDWDSLPSPVGLDSNVAIIHEPDAHGNQGLVVRYDDSTWSTLGYHWVSTGVVASGDTFSTITSTILANPSIDGNTTNRYLASFDNGVIRGIASINTTTGQATLTTPNSATPSSGNFKLLQSNSYLPVATQQQSHTRAKVSGTSDAIVATTIPAVTAVSGTRITLTPSAANSTSTPTLNATGSPFYIKKKDFTGTLANPVPGDYNASGPFDFEYNGTYWILLNPVISPVPVGAIFYFPSPSAPSGFLKANGATISAVTYPQLTTYLGSTTLPDLRGVFVRGLDDGRGFDTSRVLGSYQADAYGSHNHTASSAVTDPGHVHSTIDPGHAHQYLNAGSSTPNTGPQANANSNTGRLEQTGSSSTGISIVSHSTGVTVSTTLGLSGGTETRPKNIAMLACIKY